MRLTRDCRAFFNNDYLIKLYVLGSIPTSTPNIVELKPTRADAEICIDDSNADYRPKETIHFNMPMYV